MTEPHEDASGRLRRAIRHPATLLTFIVGLSFLPALTTGTFFVRDIMFHYVPSRAFLMSALAAGDMPLWNPLLHGGQPFLANPQNLATYPPWIASSVVPLLTGLNGMIVLHMLLASLSAYWLGRVLGLGRTAAFVVGFGFCFSGVIVSLVNLTHMLITISWMPVLVGSWVRLLSERSVKWFALTGLAGGMLILAGGAEMIVISFITLGFFFIGWPRRDWIAWRRDATLLVGVVAMAASIGAVRIWTTVEYLPETSRGESQSYSEMVRFSVHPRRLPELVAPGFMGSTSGIETTKYWGRELEGGLPYLFSIHLGAGILLLALIGLTARDAGLARKTRVSLGVLAAGGIVLALGRHVPGFGLAEALPLISRFRYPVKVLAIVPLPIAVLAGAGLESLRGFSTSGRRALARALAPFALIFLAGAISLATDAGRQFWESWFASAFDAGDEYRLAFSLTSPAIVLIALAFALYSSRFRAVIVAGVVCVELLLASHGVNSVAPRSIFDEPPHIDEVRQATGDGYFQRVRGPEVTNANPAENTDVWFARWIMEDYELYTAYLWQVPQVLHSDFDGMAPSRIVEMRDLAATGDHELVRRVLRVSGVRSVMTNDLVMSPDLELVRSFRGPGGETLFLYEDPGAKRTRFITDPLFVDSEGDAAVMLGRSDFDPDRNAVIESKPRKTEPCTDPSSMVRVERTGPDLVSYEVASPCAGYLVVSDTFVRGWTTKVDGEEVQAVHANLAFTGIPLNAGAHSIVRTYEPKGLVPSLLVSSVAGLAAVLLGLVVPLTGKGGGPHPTSE